MKCLKTRESIIRERIEELTNKEIEYHYTIYSNVDNTRRHKSQCYDRAINRMYKLINPKK